jgi:hypothetical protein
MRPISHRPSACASRKATDLDKDAATRLYTECPQPTIRTAALARLRSLDEAAADTLVGHTLEAPETIVTGVAAVKAAMAAGRTDLLVAVVERTTVARGIRREALATLAHAGAPGVDALILKHGAFLGYRASPAVPTAAAGAKGAAGGTR